MEIKVDEFAMSPKRFIAGTKGSYGFSTLNFKFSRHWDGLAKKVTFYPSNGEPKCVVFTGNEVMIPKEIMTSPGVNKYAVSGSRDGNILISIIGEIDVLNTLDPVDDPAQEPTPSQLEQIMDMMQTAVDTANSVRSDADNGVFDGESGKQGIQGESGLVPRVDAETSSGMIELSANTEYHFPALTDDLTITFGAEEDGFSNEWIFILPQGGTAQTVTLPEIEWYLGIAPTFGANTVTEVRVHKVGDAYKGVWIA